MSPEAVPILAEVSNWVVASKSIIVTSEQLSGRNLVHGLTRGRAHTIFSWRDLDRAMCSYRSTARQWAQTGPRALIRFGGASRHPENAKTFPMRKVGAASALRISPIS